ncbi:hypothetical protein [Paraclostridium dentum]|uniref:hypothetical protein n=1 Tax=Paraclostridium dentum TaxID=2662455 RepID=UPI003F4074E5
MSNFKKTLKDNVVAPYNKYNLSQEKLGEVISTNEKRNTCSVTYRNVDGIKVVKDNVPVKNSKGLFNGFPKVGDYVELQEVGRTVRILSVVDQSLIGNSNTETNDIYSNSSDACGYLGI